MIVEWLYLFGSLAYLIASVLLFWTVQTEYAF